LGQTGAQQFTPDITDAIDMLAPDRLFGGRVFFCVQGYVGCSSWRTGTDVAERAFGRKGAASMSVGTPSGQRRRRCPNAETLVAMLRAGAVLHRYWNDNHTISWRVLNGREALSVRAAIVAPLIVEGRIVGTGDTLFDSVPSQTFKLSRTYTP
jgi:hypothetical protein